MFEKINFVETFIRLMCKLLMNYYTNHKTMFYSLEDNVGHFSSIQCMG